MLRAVAGASEGQLAVQERQRAYGNAEGGLKVRPERGNAVKVRGKPFFKTFQNQCPDA